MTIKGSTIIPKKGTDLELSIDSLAFGGMGVARIDDMIVFVKNAIPGQTVLARITKKRTSFLEARTLEIIQESSLAIDVPCQHFKDCGGCTFQNLDYAEQLAAKEIQVKDIFRRIGGFKGITVEPILGCEKIFNYRNKMEFTFSNRRWLTENESEGLSADFALGLHVPGRYDKILNINECHIQSNDSNRILDIVKTMTMELGLAPYDIKAHTGFMRHLMIKHGGVSNEIMVNILQNAREAIPENCKIKLTASAGEGYSILVTIEDSGPGMSQELLDQIFEPYFTTKEKGTGLGLAIVRHNVEIYGGHLKVESQLGEGTKFILQFPARTLIKLQRNPG